MSYTNETTHYGIPKPLGSDLTVPMDYNTAADAVDAALFEAQSNASQAAEDASNAVDTANQAASDVGDIGSDLNTVKGRVTALEQSDVIQDNKIAGLETAMPTKFDSVGIADAYVNGLTYNVGDVVTYNGQRYICNTAITAAEPFDQSKWTAKDIQTDLDQIESDVAGHTHREMTDGRTCAQIFGGLATVFNALTEAQKSRAKLIYGNTASANRTTFKVGGFSDTLGIFESMEVSYIAGDSVFVTSLHTIKISTVSTNCERLQFNISANQAPTSNVVVNSTGVINYNDVIGSPSDTHYFELIY